jgi:fructokinase
MILSCGESLIDLLVGKASGAGLASEAVPGGSPFNVAIGIARLGGKAGFLSKISDDFFGRYLVRTLVKAGVDQRFLLSSPRQTTLSVAVTRPDGEAQYSFYGHESADRSLLPSELPATLPDDVSAIAIGSYTLAIDPTASAIEQLIEREHVRRVVSIDPNIRPTIIGDAKAWRPRFERLLARCHIVKASTEDLAYLYGDGVDAGAWAAHWLTAGPQLVIITRGDDGASVFFGSSTYNVPVRKVDVIDTVGAGDSFHAAVLVSLEEQNLLRPGAIRLASRDALIRAIHFAIVASSVTCSRQGADLPTRADVEAVLLSTHPKALQQ